MSTRPPRPVHRWHAAATAVAVGVLLTGCRTTYASSQPDVAPAAANATAASPRPTGPADTSSAPTSSPPTRGQVTAAPADVPGMSMPAPSSTGVPSATAQMICSGEVRTAIATMLQLNPAPDPTSTYINQQYICTYHLSVGPLVLAVQDTADVSAARNYFESLRRTLPASQTLTGMAALGLPAFETSTGTVVFLKDDKTLKVDATALPSRIGPNRQTRTDIAYQIATDIIGCWRGQ